MSEKFKDFMKNKNNLVVIVLAGILLMVIALPVDNSKNSKKNENKTTNVAEGNINNSSQAEVGQDLEANFSGEMAETGEYITALEKKVEAVLEKMEGAGRVKVIITLRSSMEKVVEKDEPIARSNTAEEDSEGGTRTVNTVDAKENTVYSSEGSNSEPYVVKIISPEVEGVVVLVEGAGNGTVNANITEAIQVLFGIEAHRIKVIKMKVTN